MNRTVGYGRDSRTWQVCVAVMPIFLGAALSAGAFVSYATVRSEHALTPQDERRIVAETREYIDHQTAILRADLRAIQETQLQILLQLRQPKP